MSAFDLVKEAVGESLPILNTLPFIDKAVKYFNKAHIYFRGWRFGQIIRNYNPDDGNPAVKAAALDLFRDSDSIFSYMITLALVTKCAQDLFTQYQQVIEKYQRLSDTFYSEYPLYTRVEWSDEREPHAYRLIPPSWSAWWQGSVESKGRQMIAVAWCISSLFAEIFKLSMFLCDAKLLLEGDPLASYEACTELVADWNNYQAQLKEHQQRICEEIEKNQELANRILVRFKSEKNIQLLLDELRKKMGTLIQEGGKMIDVKEAVDFFYIPGKITPFQLEYSRKIPKSTLPPGKFPPWGGKKILLPPSTDSLSASLLKQIQTVEKNLRSLMNKMLSSNK